MTFLVCFAFTIGCKKKKKKPAEQHDLLPSCPEKGSLNAPGPCHMCVISMVTLSHHASSKEMEKSICAETRSVRGERF